MNLISTQNKSNLSTLSFIRRDDLTPEIRLEIAFHAMHGNWGVITELASKHFISRTFIYTLKAQIQNAIQQIFGSKHKTEKQSITKEIIKFILSLRMEARSSIIPISQIMKEYNFPFYYSVGSVSEILNWIGNQLPCTLDVADEGNIQFVVIASDEIFSNSQPILITVDPISTAILRMELVDSRTTEKWVTHWQCIKDHGFSVYKLVNDEGISMASAQKLVFDDIIRQPDTFHGIAYRLGIWSTRLEIAAYKRIETEINRYDRLDSIKSKTVLNRKIDEYEVEKDKTDYAILEYDNFTFLYHELIKNLIIFDTTGSLNSRSVAEANVSAALDLMEELKIEKLNKTIKKIRRILPELFIYLDEAKNIYNELLSLDISTDCLTSLCIAWQFHKNWVKAKNIQRKKYYKIKEQEELKLVQLCLSNKAYEKFKKHVYLELDKIIQSSAIVENINSIIRMYLNSTKNHISQNFLNLIMHYLNYRRFVAGKRKGKTPIEILTGDAQDKDWLEILFDKVPIENFTFKKVS